MSQLTLKPRKLFLIKILKIHQGSTKSLSNGERHDLNLNPAMTLIAAPHPTHYLSILCRQSKCVVTKLRTNYR